MTAVLTTLALLVDGIAILVVDVVGTRPWAIATGVVLALILVGLLIALPRSLLTRNEAR
jgi:hypothetical protein